MKIPIALQLYSVRHDCAQDLLGVIRKVAAMGYEGVEFAGYHGHSADDIRKVLDECGIVCSGTHTPMSDLEPEKFEATVDLHKTLGTTFVIIPWIPAEMRNSAAACTETARKLTELTHQLEAQGLRCGFHAHDGDMKPLDNGRSAWDMLAEGTPSSFIMQYDTANGMWGGADPVQPIRDWPGRNASLHLKGWAGGKSALVGEGDIPWPQVFDAAENGGGVEWYVVEHEDEAIPPLEAVDRCLKNLRRMGK